MSKVRTTLKARVEPLVAKGLKCQQIADELGVDVSRVYTAKRAIAHQPGVMQVHDIDANVDKYEPIMMANIKHTLIHVSNILANKNMQKESSPQLAKTMGILIDKLRLIEGKSTQNISANIVAQLAPEQLEILNEMGRSLISSMLK